MKSIHEAELKYTKSTIVIRDYIDVGINADPGYTELKKDLEALDIPNCFYGEEIKDFTTVLCFFFNDIKSDIRQHRATLNKIFSKYQCEKTKNKE